MTNDPTMFDCLLGGALGDSVGLPFEGMSASRIAKLRPYPLEQSLFFRKGMVSDDTEHAVMTLLSLDGADGNVERFTRELAGRLRWWLVGLPAGIGLGTVRSISKLWIGISPLRSGSSSAGNGPMMRAAVIGVRFARQEELRRKFVDASTLVTHRDQRAIEGARIIAECAALAMMKADEDVILAKLADLLESDELRVRLGLIQGSLDMRLSVGDFANRFGRKKGMVSGFSPDTAAVAIYAWLKYRGDFRGGLEAVIDAGGDTDTVGFITGSLLGIEVGAGGMPLSWRDGLRDFPISPTWLERLISRDQLKFPNFPFSLPRNLLFLIVVICHGLRRVIPPY